MIVGLNQPDLPSTDSLKADCPRCGYDQSGAIAGWDRSDTRACPLLGVCSECGLRFAWGELLNPRLTTPPWSYEHAAQRLARSALRTAARSLWPPTFWARLRMEHPINTRRLTALAVLIASAVCVLVCALIGWLASEAITGRVPLFDPDGSPRWIGAATNPVVVLVLSGLTLVSPVGGLSWAAVAALWPVLAPAFFLALPDTLRSCRVRKVHLLRGCVYSLPAVAALLALWQTGRLSSLILGGSSLPGLTLAAIADVLGKITGPAATLLAPVGGFLALSWWCVTRRYLRLPHAAGVTAAILLMSGITAFLIVLFCNWGSMSRCVSW